MNGKRTFAIFTLLVFVVPIVSVNSWVYNDGRPEDTKFEAFGPRLDSLLIKIYNKTSILLSLEIGEIDIIDRSLSLTEIERWSRTPFNETIVLSKYPEVGMYVLDLNNNLTMPSYPYWRSPTSYIEFRHAISHLINKTRIISEVLKGYGITMSTPIMPWLEKWFNPDADPHPYNPLEAATILDDAGFIQGSTPNPYYNSSKPGSAPFIRVYPSGHEKEGQDLDKLMFYARHDDPNRLDAAYMIRDELLSVGIPVEISGPIRIQELFDKIWILHDYHLYTGGWLLSTDPTYLYDLYHSQRYGPGLTNYNNVNDDELDHWLEILIEAPDQQTAKTACLEAQRRLAEIVGVIPLWAPVQVKAYRKGWRGIVNEENVGVDSWWTFLNARPRDLEEGGTFRYGFSGDIDMLNPIFSRQIWDWMVLDKIYDTLIKHNPYNVTEEVPWMAEDWNVETWNGNRTKLTFYLRKNIYWHDGEEFTSQDVKFTIEYLKSYPWDWFMWGGPPPPIYYYNVVGVLDVDAPDLYTVVVYMDTPRFMALHEIGGLPILPKHIWENIPITEALFTSDPNLVGTGPYKFVEYVEGDHILLDANTNYFRYCPLQAKVDIQSRRVDPGNMLNYSVIFDNYFANKSTNTTVYVYFDGVLVENKTLTIKSSLHAELGPYILESLTRGLHEIKIEHRRDPHLNRTCTYTMSIWTTIIEDVDLDFEVTIRDISTVARAFGSYPGHDRWNTVADMNHDYEVDIRDIAAVARKFGWHG